jgi:hypothetical protein
MREEWKKKKFACGLVVCARYEEMLVACVLLVVIKSEVAPDWGEAALGRAFNLR